MSSGFKGVSFPFRLGNKGGIVLSTTSYTEVPHIEESIKQILSTRKGERIMEPQFGSLIDTQIFETNDESSHALIKFQIEEALKEQEPRIEVEDIKLTSEGEFIYVTLEYKVIQYNTNYTYTFKLSEGGES